MSATGVRNIRLGLLVVALVSALLWWRANQPPARNHYAAIISDASELVPDNSVRINDVPVGQVTKVVLDGLHAKVSFNLDRDVHLPAGTRVELRQTSLLGEEYLALVPAGKGTLREGTTIPLDRTRRVRDSGIVVPSRNCPEPSGTRARYSSPSRLVWRSSTRVPVGRCTSRSRLKLTLACRPSSTTLVTWPTGTSLMRTLLSGTSSDASDSRAE